MQCASVKTWLRQRQARSCSGILAEGESYGYAILQRVSQLSDGELAWSDGMLYPLLHRLERLGYVESAWRKAPTGASESTTCLPLRAARLSLNSAHNGRQ